jgi:hypothetical protein
MPLKMNPEALGWMNRAIVEGSELSREEVESLKIINGIGLFSEVIDYWNQEHSDTDKAGEEIEVDGIELNDDGSVDLSNMR